MAEYIEREAAIERTEVFCDTFVTKWTDEKVLAWIRKLPAADVAPVVHGRWEQRAIERSDPDGGWLAVEYHCPLCGRIEYRKEPYCNCGAKMDGE